MVSVGRGVWERIIASLGLVTLATILSIFYVHLVCLRLSLEEEEIRKNPTCHIHLSLSTGVGELKYSIGALQLGQRYLRSKN